MKQTVNLLHDELKPVVQRISLKNTAIVAALLFIAVSLLTITEHWQLQAQQQRLADAKADLQAAQARQQQLRQQLEQRTASPELVAQVEQLQQQVTTQQHMNERLAERQDSQHRHPDQLMTELQRIDIDGVWLTEFSLRPEGVSLAGKALRANMLPRWMQQFATTELLSQSRFAVVGLDQNEQGHQLFRLTNQPTAAEHDSDTESNSGEQP